jgi:hypothetical protein
MKTRMVRDLKEEPEVEEVAEEEAEEDISSNE